MTAMLLFFAVLVAAVILGWFLLSGAPPPAQPRPEPPERERQTFRAGVQVLFSETTGTLLTIDGVVLTRAPSGPPPGTLLSLQLETPVTAPVSTVVLTTLDRWAKHGNVVDLELRAHPGAIAARLSDGTSTVNLEVAAARVG